MSELRSTRRSRSAHRAREVTWAVALGLVLAAATQAQTLRVPTASAVELKMRAYTLRHQPAGDAVALVSSMLSDRGSVELQPLGNTIVIRDEPSRIVRIIPVLRSFDHPRQTVRLEVRIVRASVHPPPRTAAAQPQLSSVVTQRLRDLLRFQHYDLLAGADLESREGDPVLYDVGSEYRVELRVGTVLASRRLKLHDFRIARAGGEGEAWKPLLHTNLELTIEEPMVLGLAPDESSKQALMVVLTARPELASDVGLRAE